MSTTENLTDNITGYTNIGVLYSYMHIVATELTVYEQVVAMAIGKYSLGYCRPTTNVPHDKGYNRNSKAWSDAIGISKTSFLKAIKSLTAKNLIKVHKGSVFRTDGGSFPDYYSIKFDPTLQKKHNLFFNLSGTTSKQKEDTEPEKPKSSISPERIRELKKEHNIGA